MLPESKNITRRQFLVRNSKTAAALVTAASLTSCSALRNVPKPCSTMNFGLVTYLWASKWDLPTLISNCEKTGVLGVELRTTHSHGVEPNLNKRQREDVRLRFADTPVTLVGLGSDERFDNPDPAVLAKAIEATKAFVKLSQDVGATGVKVKPNSFHKDVPHEKTIEQIGKSLNIVGAYAADYNQQIRLEVHGQCAELPTIKAIMDIADNPNVFVCWNSNKQDLSGNGLEYNFNLVKDRFGATAHVHDLNSTEYPYQQLMNLFVKMDYKGWLMLEASTKPQDYITALIEQRNIFENLLAKALTQV